MTKDTKSVNILKVSRSEFRTFMASNLEKLHENGIVDFNLANDGSWTCKLIDEDFYREVIVDNEDCF